LDRKRRVCRVTCQTASSDCHWKIKTHLPTLLQASIIRGGRHSISQPLSLALPTLTSPLRQLVELYSSLKPCLCGSSKTLTLPYPTRSWDIGHLKAIRRSVKRLRTTKVRSSVKTLTPDRYKLPTHGAILTCSSLGLKSISKNNLRTSYSTIRSPSETFRSLHQQ